MADHDVSQGEITDALAGLATAEQMRDLIDRMSDAFDDTVSELEEVRASRDEIEAELEARNGGAFDVLRSVRDWFDNVILLGRPMTDPRAMWKQVERVLQCE